MKAYEPVHDGKGLTVPWVTVAGRRAIPPTEIVRAYATARGTGSAELEFVHFLEGREREKRAVVASADTLARSVERPKWDLLQP